MCVEFPSKGGKNADVLLLWKSTSSKELTKVNREANFYVIVQKAGNHLYPKAFAALVAALCMFSAVISTMTVDFALTPACVIGTSGKPTF